MAGIFSQLGFLHGGDYNGDQWLDRPDILDEDIRLMREAHVNCVSLGIFSWALLEPQEGVYDFAWLDALMDRLYAGGVHVFLATPSAAKPAWMAEKYPEVLRCGPDFERAHFGERHNHCPSSPVYQAKTQAIDRALALRYGKHPAVIGWHIGNEFGGDCRCPLCAENFRTWLKNKYGSLDSLNARWYTSFWSQRYSAWSQVEPPSPRGEVSNPSMWVDWRRFETELCKRFITMEKKTVQAVNPELPCTANLMERFWDYNYFSLAEAIDFVSWDSYPEWGSGDDIARAAEFAMNHDIMRSLKDAPFFLIESTPSLVNWKPHNKLKRPGMHLLSSMQAVAHGSDSVMMFQWRKGRGGSEAFHGAVVSHDRRSDTRVFRDVQEVGQTLEALRPLCGEAVQAEACVIFDWENRWALDYVQAAQKGNMRYFDTVNMYYRALWERGIRVDLRDMRECTDLSRYKLVVAPLLFMQRNGFDRKLRDFVENGGTLLTTFFSGIVDADDLTFLGDAPHGLTDVLGLRAEELDSLYPEDSNALLLDGKAYAVHELCEIARDVTAEVVGTYESDFYAGFPCLTVNRFGKGKAWYLAAKADQPGVNAVMAKVIEGVGLNSANPGEMPEGVVATARGEAVFVQNFSGKPQRFPLEGTWRDMRTGDDVSGTVSLPENGLLILQKCQENP